MVVSSSFFCFKFDGAKIEIIPESSKFWGDFLFELDDITPSCSGVLALEIVLDGVGENISLTLAVFLGILLGSEDDSLASMQSVNPIYYLIESLHFLELFSIDVEEILLN